MIHKSSVNVLFTYYFPKGDRQLHAHVAPQRAMNRTLILIVIIAPIRSERKYVATFVCLHHPRVEFSIMSRGTRTIEIYRYDPDLDAAPRMQTYTTELLDSDRMLLDVLLRLKKEDETLTFRRSCREGICGSDGMNINGKNGAACLINMNTLRKKVTVRPLPGLPVVRDLVVDMNQFYEQYEKSTPVLNQ